MNIKKKIDHGSSICYVVDNVKGMTFNDLISWSETNHKQSWQVSGCNINHLKQAWIMLTDNSIPIGSPYNLKRLFFFLNRIEDAPNSAFEQCIENYEQAAHTWEWDQIGKTRKGNTAKLPWTKGENHE